jgi:hypothetical protein
MVEKILPLHNVDWKLSVDDRGVFTLHDFLSDSSILIDDEDFDVIKDALKLMIAHTQSTVLTYVIDEIANSK